MIDPLYIAILQCRAPHSPSSTSSLELGRQASLLVDADFTCVLCLLELCCNNGNPSTALSATCFCLQVDSVSLTVSDNDSTHPFGLCLLVLCRVDAVSLALSDALPTIPPASYRPVASTFEVVRQGAWLSTSHDVISATCRAYIAECINACTYAS